MSELVAKASRYASAAHERIGQRRKYTLEPYHVHLEAVARLVGSVTDDAVMIAAAWLHDIVEDTPETLQDIEREFGADVMALVAELTDVSRPQDGNRAVRKSLDRARLSRASPRAKTIKLADLMHNCEDICRHNRGFGRVYLAEARALLEVLKEGDSRLYDKAAATLAHWTARLATPRAKT
jgi:(p)ppGpp synthase/HD superfamily hydrolase